MGRARFVFHSESVSPSQHWQWLVLGEGDLSHDEAPAKLSTGTGDSTTSAGAFRSQPGQAAAVTYYTPHLPALHRTHHHHPVIPGPNIHYSTQDLHPAHCSLSLYWLSAGWCSVQDHRKLSGLGPSLVLDCHGVGSGEAETAWVLPGPRVRY